MKRLLTLLLFVFTSVTAFSQNLYLRASSFNIGKKSTESTAISWGTAVPVNILIQIEENKATIFSQSKQVYRLISTTEERVGYVKYYCTNDDGINCNLIVFTLPEYPGHVYFTVEFSDYIWYYVAKKE